MHDLPHTVDLAPHVGEASLHRLAVVLRTGHEGVHAGVEIRVWAEALHIVGGDGALRQLLEEVHKVLLGRLAVADELRRHGREEGQVLGAVQGRNLLVVLLLERVVPSLEICLQQITERVNVINVKHDK